MGKIIQNTKLERARLSNITGTAVLFENRMANNPLFEKRALYKTDIEFYQNEAANLINAADQLMDRWSGQGSQLKEAKRIIQSVLSANEKFAPAYLALAQHGMASGHIAGKRYRKGAKESAKRNLEKALLLDSDFADALVYFAYWHMQSYRNDLAKEMLQKAEIIGTDNPWIELHWAQIHGDAGMDEKSAERLRKAIVLAKAAENKRALWSAYGKMVDSYAKMHEIDKAKIAYKKMITLIPNNAWARGDRVHAVLFRGGDIDWALSIAEQALALKRYGVVTALYGKAKYVKASILLAEGKKAEADEAFTMATKYYPNFNNFMTKAGSFDDEEIAKSLVASFLLKGATINYKDDRGNSVLSGAIHANRNILTHWLLDKGADIELRDQTTNTPLGIATSKGYRELATALITLGADINAKNIIYGTFPILNAVSRRDLPLLDLLLKKGALIDVKTTDGRTALGTAVAMGELEIVKKLIAGGADTQFLFQGQYSLKDIARENDQIEVLAFLEEN